ERNERLHSLYGSGLDARSLSACCNSCSTLVTSIPFSAQACFTVFLPPQQKSSPYFLNTCAFLKSFATNSPRVSSVSFVSLLLILTFHHSGPCSRYSQLKIFPLSPSN